MLPGCNDRSLPVSICSAVRMQTSVTAVAVDGVLCPSIAYFDVLRMYRIVEFVHEILFMNDYGVVVAKLGQPCITSQCVGDYPRAR